MIDDASAGESKWFRTTSVVTLQTLVHCERYERTEPLETPAPPAPAPASCRRAACGSTLNATGIYIHFDLHAPALAPAPASTLKEYYVV
ncbi:unnamed protein product [Parnassius apollo]|uniref:(apollo) hypothetical protein n=1 Tax=Parnassius apollo TaxID=110799 RepID=A0A8S3YDP5_PARAO|nr:unnamed protein product [Parnassius apollo]